MYTPWKLFLAVSAIWALGTQLVSVSALEPVSDESNLQKRDANHPLRARQAPPPKPSVPPAPPQNGGKPPNPGEEAAGQLIAMLIQTGEALDATTHMGSNSTIVKLGSEAVLKMLPELKLGREKVLKAVNRDANDESAKKLVAASDKITKILKDISAKPEDSNLIKVNYGALTQAFGDVFGAAEAAINIVIPAAVAELEAKKPKPPADPKKDGQPPKQ